MNNDLTDLGQQDFTDFREYIKSVNEYAKKVMDYMIQHDGFCKSHREIANFYKDKNYNRFLLGLTICIRDRAVKNVKDGYELIQKNDRQRQLTQGQPFKDIMFKHGKDIRGGNIPLNIDEVLSGSLLNQEIDGVKLGDIMINQFKKLMEEAEAEEKKVNGFKSQVKIYKKFKEIKHK